MLFARIIFVLTLAAMIAGASFAYGLYTGARRTALFDLIRDQRTQLELLFKQVSAPGDFELAARSPGDKSGVSVNTVGDDGLVMLSGYIDGSLRVRLIDRAGATIADWPVRIDDHFDILPGDEAPLLGQRTDIHGALINPDGSVVFNFEYLGTVKLSACGETEWRLPERTHHSVERSESGGYWIPGRTLVTKARPEDHPPFTANGNSAGYFDDLIVKVSETGEIIEEVSVMKMMVENGYLGLMTATGETFQGAGDWWDRELVHLNKIGELSAEHAAAFPMFKAGDLVLSYRNYNMIVVVEPGTWRVKWTKTGPWLRQHDPEFGADGGIWVFDNASLDAPRKFDGYDGPSNIMRADPATGEVETVLGGALGPEFFTAIRGKHELLPDGGLLVTEFDGGRIFQTDRAGVIVWEYVNRLDPERVGELTEARLYPRNYFTTDFTCG